MVLDPCVIYFHLIYVVHALLLEFLLQIAS